jgi:hypothetical protein
LIREFFRRALWLTFPLWALVSVLALIGLSSNGAQVPGEPVVLFGLLTPFVGAVPIFRLSTGALFKALIFSLYYLVCVIAMVIIGWAALGIFGIAG